VGHVCPSPEKTFTIGVSTDGYTVLAHPPSPGFSHEFTEPKILLISRSFWSIHLRNLLTVTYSTVTVFYHQIIILKTLTPPELEGVLFVATNTFALQQ
jgi:hypothetical protein